MSIAGKRGLTHCSPLPPLITVCCGSIPFWMATVVSCASYRMPACSVRSIPAVFGQSHAGLARNIDAYKAHLADCDLPRRNNLDGHGDLSEETLAAFTRFFLETCIDQINFMESLVEPDRLRTRMLIWVEEETRLSRLPPKSGNILEAVLYRGELPRADIAGVVGTGERQARRIVAGLCEQGVLVSESPRAPLRLVFPAVLASRWMPGLFPEKTE
jgi:hypothetical protein